MSDHQNVVDKEGDEETLDTVDRPMMRSSLSVPISGSASRFYEGVDDTESIPGTRERSGSLTSSLMTPSVSTFQRLQRSGSLSNIPFYHRSTSAGRSRTSSGSRPSSRNMTPNHSSAHRSSSRNSTPQQSMGAQRSGSRNSTPTQSVRSGSPYVVNNINGEQSRRSRDTTPNVSSAGIAAVTSSSNESPRAISAPRDFIRQQRLMDAVKDTQTLLSHRATSAHRSRRKVRQYENDKLQESLALLRKHWGDDKLDDDEDGSWYANFDWKTNITKLFDQKNFASKEVFRTCHEHAYTSMGRGVTAGTRRRMRTDDFGEADAEWVSKVEKRLRSVVLRSMQSRAESILPFVKAIEDVLLYFAETQRLPSSEALPSQLDYLTNECLVAPLRLTQRKLNPKSKDISDKNMGTCLTLELKNSFHRLLVHTAAQFYNMRSHSSSSSTTTSNKKGVAKSEASLKGDGDNTKYTYVFALREVTLQKTPMVSTRTSLAAYLHVSTSDAVDED